MKGQEELIGMNGVFKKRRIGNANKNNITSSSEDEQFEDALSSPQSLCQRYLGVKKNTKILPI
ncbi:hypothetical protein RirG_035140 [Rhizophagus irregularis DAOM 197198w]|uniref:Uncharacterized protein n=1 Tax=Rhizophagus irregularis (strain DAOM 197198w) TaxID=1432141 RepID=A0A015NAJ2_RHIIW|nr:hypothetical protein RirG_035140 [Rhizophagus irregularis DAOM 197198w]